MRSRSDGFVQTPSSSTTIPEDLARCGFLDAISLDPRPTFVIDSHDTSRDAGPVYRNPALDELPGLCEDVRAGRATVASAQARWTSFTIQGRWKVVAATAPLLDGALGSLRSLSPPRDQGISHEVVFRDVSGDASSPTKSQSRQVKRTRQMVSPSRNLDIMPVDSIDTAAALPDEFLATRIRGDSVYVRFFREFDWAATELGPIATWSSHLVEVCNLMLASPDPIGIYWGPNAIALYNEAIVATIGDRHPHALGRRVGDAFPEVWEGHFKPLFEDIMEKRQPWVQYNERRLGYNEGNLEEVFWKLAYFPILGEDDVVCGTWGTLHDVTTQNFWQRRVAILLRLTASMNASESFEAMWAAFTVGFEPGDRDVPHLLVYTSSEDLSSPQPVKSYQLKNSFGYDLSKGPYDRVDMTDQTQPMARLFRQTLDVDAPTCFERSSVDLPPEFWDAFQTTDPDGACRTIVITPIRPTLAKDALAYLVIGFNPFVRFDRHYREFIDLARRQVSSTMTSILLREEEIKRERLVAEEASNQLALWKAEAEMHELRFTRLAETAPIGICTYAGDGSLTYANDVYRNIFGMSADDDASGSEWWAHLVQPEDLDMAKVMFGRLIMERVDVAFEIRVKANPKHKATPGPEGYVWVLVSAYAESTGSGPQTAIACFTDINERKRAEDHQNRRLEDMINAKRQQEAFIDMTSHEIRNPLSVVLQCGEEIISTCMTLRSDEKEIRTAKGRQDLDGILDAAETIEFCTLHQKRIVDDILTLSKLESDLLPVTPDTVQPITLVDGIMKLFERELRKSDTKVTISVHPSFQKLRLDRVKLDPSRFSQIIINLISNAIKFTKTQNERRLDIMLGGSLDNTRPAAGDWPVSYIDRQQPVRKDVFSAYWTEAEAAHLHFAVLDTGAGMSDEEQQRIFSRFTQASPRTHVKYGGSGLGLYICRALSETHGGQIGCTSVSGKGSAFGFHVEVGVVAPQPQTTVPDTHHPPPLSRPSNPQTTLSTSYIDPDSSDSRVLSSVPVITSTETPTAAAAAAAPKLPSFNVLVVEDNILNQKVIRRQLEKAGHTVVVAHHGQDALDVLRNTRAWVGSVQSEPPFSFILMDVEMPIMDGLVCTRRIREYERQGVMLGHVPIIATTGNARDEKTGMALDAGMDQVVLKPYSLSTLLPIAQKLWEQHGNLDGPALIERQA